MLSKWLDAARKRLGGTFPRDAARAEMEAYAEKMRRRKLKGGKQAVAGVVEDETTEAARLEKRVVRLSQASTALARRWLRAAQDSIQARFSASLAFDLRLVHTPSPSGSRRRRMGGTRRHRRERTHAVTTTKHRRASGSGARSSGTTARSAWARCPRRTSGSTAPI